MALINTLNDIGNAIREKTGGTELIPLKEMASAIQGISSGGGAELNIAYGDTEPDDTSKLWIKANEPESIVFGKDFEGVESLSILDTALPRAYNGMGCASVGNKIYLFGGVYSSGYLKTINVFDTETQAITTLGTNLINGKVDMGCASVGNKIYLFGGREGTYFNKIDVFDTETQSITTLSTTLPMLGYGMGCASVGNKIYLLGGKYYDGGDRITGTLYCFDTKTETVTTLSTTLPTACYFMGCASVGTKIYLFGGQNSSGYLKTINVFDTETQAITTLNTTLPIETNAVRCASVGTKIYLFGGQNSSGYLKTINVFDTETQSIATLSTTLPTACYKMGCASVGTKICLFGGYGDSGDINTINQFTVSKELTQNNIEVITAYKNFFNVVNTDTMKVEIGVDSVLIGNAENQAENCEAYLYQNESWVQI